MSYMGGYQQPPTSPPPPGYQGWVPPPGPVQQWPAWGPPPQRRSRAPLVIAAVVIVAIVMGLLVLLVYFASQLAPLVSRTAFDDLTVGQCFNGGRVVGGTSEVVFGAEVVDCSVAHESELIATFDHPNGGRGVPFPGSETVSAFADDECLGHFESYVGLSFEASVLGMTSIYPQEWNWNLGDYSIQCVVHPPDGEATATGSYRNARR